VVPKEIKPCDQAVVTAELQNIGTRDGDEVTNYDGSSLFSFTIVTLFSVCELFSLQVTQVYINWPNATVPVPQMQLVGFKRSFLKASESVEVSIH
jgi:hypothetical protein